MLGAWASQLCGWHDLNAIMQQLGLVSGLLFRHRLKSRCGCLLGDGVGMTTRKRVFLNT